MYISMCACVCECVYVFTAKNKQIDRIDSPEPRKFESLVQKAKTCKMYLDDGDKEHS